MSLTLNSTEYLAFASFTYAATTYYIGTVAEVRGGNQYESVIQTPPLLEMDFGAELSLTQAANIDLVIADGAGGVYRTLADANILDGVLVTVTLVNRFHWNDGTTTETTYGQQLTVVGSTLAPGTVTLHLQDLENNKLEALFPLTTWQTTDFPEVSSDDAGKCICEPVGTAIKLPCVLLHSDIDNSQYWYGVCTGNPRTFPIGSITALHLFQILGVDVSAFFFVGQKILVAGNASGNDGEYTVSNIQFVGGNTRVTTVEGAIANTGAGNLYILPMPLTVYRNKRIISTAEYSQLFGYPFAPVANGNFAAGGTGWTPVVVGSGTVAFSTGLCTITGTTAINTGFIKQTISAGVGLIKAVFAVQVTLAAGSSDASVQGDALTIGRIKGGATATTGTVFVTTTVATSSAKLQIGIWNGVGTALITNVRVIPMNLSLLQFALPQIDFNGTPYVIEADVSGVEFRECCTEIQRLLNKAGVTSDVVTFTAAVAQTFPKLLDCDYGRTGQRKFSAILDDLLVVARAGLSRNSVGAYTIWQDVAGSAIATYDQSLGDLLNVQKIETTAGRPASVALSYAPSSSDSSAMTVTLTRNVTGGVLGAQTPREIRYLRDATTADALLCYTALRAQFCKMATVDIYRTQNNIGDIVTITCPHLWTGPRTFTAWTLKRVSSGNEMMLQEYDPSIFTYTPGTLPTNATTGYQPDFSFTSPAAPTTLAITAASAHVNNDGSTSSYATCQATPPSVNWESIWFAAIHNVTGEITLAQGSSIGGGLYGATIAMLRPGEVYKLQCYAVNSNNIQGVVQSTFDTTAIGGGPGVTTFTTPGQTVLPPVVSSLTVAQASAKGVRVSWPLVTALNLFAYSLEKQIGAGAFNEVFRGNALAYVDTAVNYTNTYTYRVRALDNYGNFSASYATSGSISPSGNISGGSAGDIQTSTVSTVNRTAVTTATSAWNFTVGATRTYSQNLTVTHSLGVVPVTALVSGSTAVSASPSSVTSSNMIVVLNGAGLLTFAFNSSGTLTGPASFAALACNGASGTVTANVW